MDTALSFRIGDTPKEMCQPDMIQLKQEIVEQAYANMLKATTTDPLFPLIVGSVYAENSSDIRWCNLVVITNVDCGEGREFIEITSLRTTGMVHKGTFQNRIRRQQLMLVSNKILDLSTSPAAPAGDFSDILRNNQS